MWGTIARLRVRQGVPEDYLVAQMRALNTARMGGWQGTTIYRSDADPHELWMVVMFESKEAYQRNAASSAQHQLYLTLRACLEADPEWHDVAEIAALPMDAPPAAH